MINEQYSVSEILDAVEEIQNKKKGLNKIKQSNLIKAEKFLDIPSNTLKLIEEAEKKGISISDLEAREHIYGMPYSEWKTKYQK